MWHKSEIMNEFLKIAEEQGMFKTAADESDLKENTLPEPEKSIIEIAHPDSVYVAEARGDGGLVENEIENQKKIIEIIKKMPTGALLGTYASSILTLIKMANACDDIGEKEAANKITKAAELLIEGIDKLEK